MIKLPFILAFSWLLMKTIMLQLGYVNEKVGVMVNLFFLVLVIFMAIRALRRENDFFTMLKAGMRPAAVYIILSCLSIFVYYQFLEPGHMPAMIEKSIQETSTVIDDAGGFNAFAKENSIVDAADKESFLAKQRESMEMIFSPFSRASQALLGLTVLALLYTLLMVGVYKLGARFIPREEQPPS